MDVLRAASQAASISRQGRPQVEFRIAAQSLAPVATVGGLAIAPDMRLDQVESCDMLLLPAMWRNPQPTLGSEGVLLELLPELSRAGSTICCVGTGSCFLAETGLLNGKAATTHWNYFKEFQRRYPDVHLKRRHLITQSDNLYCAGSINSIADLMIHLVEDWFGPRIARGVESQFSPEIRRPFGAHAFGSGEDSSHHDELVFAAQQWIADRLHEPLRIDALAQRLDCSSRTLHRRFSSATGQSPSAYLKSRRLAAAMELLRSTNLAVGEIAWQVGLQDPSYFTSVFRQHTGLTPARYRQSVRGKLFQPAL
jgi:transcriptional regulator GlxA family with amidase domain